MPVARMTACGRRARTCSTSASTPSSVRTQPGRHRLLEVVDAADGFAARQQRLWSRVLPPTAQPLPRTMTSWPRAAATQAASSPATPEPTTTTRRGRRRQGLVEFVGLGHARIVVACDRKVVDHPMPTRVARHAVVDVACPAGHGFAHPAGSLTSARPVTTRLASPRASTASASAGSVKRPSAATGTSGTPTWKARSAAGTAAAGHGRPGCASRATDDAIPGPGRSSRPRP